MTAHSEIRSEIDERIQNQRYLRSMFGRFASGITVVSCEVDGDIHAMTANSFVSVTLDPARALVSVARKSRMHELLSAGGGFGISILKNNQIDISTHFAGGEQTKTKPEFNHHQGVPVLTNALAWMVCRQDQRFDIDDHTLFVGRLMDCQYDDAEKPLLYFGGKYAALTH